MRMPGGKRNKGEREGRLENSGEYLLLCEAHLASVGEREGREGREGEGQEESGTKERENENEDEKGGE
jgi:hypothetical protein